MQENTPLNLLFTISVNFNSTNICKFYRYFEFLKKMNDMLTNPIETSSSIANFYLHEIVQIQCGTIISLFQTFLIT